MTDEQMDFASFEYDTFEQFYSEHGVVIRQASR